MSHPTPQQRKELAKACAEGRVVPLNEAARRQRRMKPMTIVKFNYDGRLYEPLIKYYKDIFGDGLWVFLGELTNMEGHGVYANYETGNIVCGYHIDDFEEYKDE